MKRAAVCVIAVMAIVAFAAGSSCAAACYAPCATTCNTEKLIGGMGKKFCRGMTNMFTGWMEIPAQISKGYRKACFGGASVGVVTGIWHFAGRTLSGCAEMSTFWAADPSDNNGVGIPLDADYAWEEGTHYSLTNPDIGTATMTPIGNKMVRGLGNLCFGILEVPSQLMKGMRAHACDWGAGKALWYWFSREADGAFDLATSVLPGPKTTTGLPFDEKWPWTYLKLDK